jgi:hypothetical protein
MEMDNEFVEGSTKREFSEQDELGEALLLHGSDPAFGKCVQIWTSWRKSEAADAL